MGLRHSTTPKKFDERRRIKVIELVFKSYVWILLLWCVPNAKVYIRQESLLSRKFWGYTRKLTFVLLFFSTYIQWSRSQISLCSSRSTNHIFSFNFFCLKAYIHTIYLTEIWKFLNIVNRAGNNVFLRKIEFQILLK